MTVVSSSRRTRARFHVLVSALLVASILAVIAPASGAAGSIAGRVDGPDGSAVAGVQIDLFRAGGDGSRAGFVSHTFTDGGGYRFDASDGCYVITMIAPDGNEFVSGSRWNQGSLCVWNGQADRVLDGQLANGAPPPAGGVSCTADQPIWNLEFEDSFTGNGRALGSAWSAYNSTGNAGYGLRRPHTLSVWDGHLNLKASMENGTLVSGGLSHRFHQTYGRYEFRVRTDRDYSQATSGIVMTWPQSNVHPRDGENNIYETLSTPGDRHEFYTFIHEPYGTVHDQDYTVHPVQADQWHTMELEWMPDRMILRRDGQTVKTIWENSDDLIPDVPHRVAIQLDAWKHQLDNPVWMQVDYIKVWSFGGMTSC